MILYIDIEYWIIENIYIFYEHCLLSAEVVGYNHGPAKLRPGGKSAIRRE